MNEFEMNSLMEEGENIPFFKKCLLMFSEPSRVFKAMKEKESYWGILLFFYAIGLITTIIMLSDYDIAMSEIDPGVASLAKNIVGIFTVLVTLVTPFIAGFIYHIVAMIQSYSGYNKTMRIYLYGSIITLSGGLIATLISTLTGNAFSFSPLLFIDPALHAELPYVLLGNLNIFSIWSLIVIYTGFRHLHGMKKNEALITVITPFVIGICITMLPFLLAGQL